MVQWTETRRKVSSNDYAHIYIEFDCILIEHNDMARIKIKVLLPQNISFQLH